MLLNDILSIKNKTNKKNKLLSKILKYLCYHREIIPELHFKNDHILNTKDLINIALLIDSVKKVVISNDTIITSKIYPSINNYEIYISNKDININNIYWSDNDIVYIILIDITKNSISITYSNKNGDSSFIVLSELNENNTKLSENKNILNYINILLKSTANICIDNIYFNT